MLSTITSTKWGLYVGHDEQSRSNTGSVASSSNGSCIQARPGLLSKQQVQLNRSPEEMFRDIRLYSALMLFRMGKLSSGVAAEMAGLPRVMFLDLCAEYDIPVSPISADDLRQELADV